MDFLDLQCDNCKSLDLIARLKLKYLLYNKNNKYESVYELWIVYEVTRDQANFSRALHSYLRMPRYT